MSVIDKKRFAAVALLEAQGCRYESGRWLTPDGSQFEAVDGDALLALLINRADYLMGATEESPADRELEALTGAIEAYELVRWPKGKTAGGKG